jgi:anti-sigma regulatory factor (Ser/Thr protein kinase)
MPEITCKIDFNVHDSLKPVRTLIDRLQAIAEADPAEAHIDLSKSRYLGPDAIALLAAIIFDRRSRAQRTRVTLPTGPAKLQAFCRFSGFTALVRGEELPTEAEETVIPLRQITAARWMDADPIIRLVHRHLEISEDLEEYLRICVNEVVQNIEDHAESPIGGVMCARYFAGRRHVRVAIVDRGVGIYTTLKRRYPDTTPGNALRRVLQGRFTALSRPNNAGLGLCNLSAMIEHLGGSFEIVSETSIAHGKGRTHRDFIALARRFRGTAVFFILPMRSP